MNEQTSRLAMTDILREPKLILAVICALASKLLSLENDTVSKAAEEVLRAYSELNPITGSKHDTEKVQTTSLFDKNVITDASLSAVDKSVYSVLCARADNEAHQCSPKVKTIAVEASCSESAVRKSLGTLEKHGVIRRKFRYINHRQISSLYTVIGYQPDPHNDF